MSVVDLAKFGGVIGMRPDERLQEPSELFAWLATAEVEQGQLKPKRKR